MLVPEYPPDVLGGGGVVFDALRREYRDAYRVRVAAGTTGFVAFDAVEDREQAVSRVRELPLPRGFRHLALTMPPTLSGLRCLMSAFEGIDLVHAHGFGFPVVDIGIRIASRRGIPVMHTLHGYPVSQTRSGAALRLAFRGYEKLSGVPALRRAGAHTAVSESVADHFRVMYGVDATVIPNGVDLPPEERWDEFDQVISLGRPIVLAVGLLTWRKGFDAILRALALIEPAARPFLAVIGADHGELPNLQRIATELRLSQHCKFLGGQSRARVAYAYRNATVCVVSSHAEGFPGVPLEAMLAGCAVIAKRMPEMASYSREGENILLFDDKDDRRLAELIRAAIGDHQLRELLISDGRRTASEYTWKSVAHRYGEVIAQLLV